jgi:probable F420-dependent oxidoreductase
MRFGVVFPQTEIGADPGGCRAFAEAAEALDYTHILAYDHVLGADPTNRPGWRGYTIDEMFHEVLVLFGYLAAATERIGLVAGVIILPQRQTALVAKQAAEVDVLSGGRLRLGVGIGWNPVEYESLNENFHNRGARIAEQIAVMRALWTHERVTFRGKRHTLDEVGIRPMPVQRPIPVWMGGWAEPALRRAARHADGWIHGGRHMTGDVLRDALGRMRGYVAAAGRDPAAFGIDAQYRMENKNPDQWRADIATWRELDATHFSVSTMGAGRKGPDAHIDAIRKFREILPQT